MADLTLEAPPPVVEAARSDPPEAAPAAVATTQVKAAPESAAERVASAAFTLTAALCMIAIGFRVFAKLDVATIYDDAFIFQRYAFNILHGNGVAWNAGGPATFGSTSLLFLIPSVLCRLIVPDYPGLAAVLASALMGLVFLGLAPYLVERAMDAPRPLKRLMILLVVFCLAVSTTGYHFVCGMDTPMGMAFLAGYLVAVLWLERSPAKSEKSPDKPAILVGVLGGLAFAARPELGAYGVAVPAAMALLGRDELERFRGRKVLALTLGVLALNLAVNRFYFHTALPLTFFAKTLDLYSGNLNKPYRGKSTAELLVFASAYWPLFLIIAADFLANVRRWFRESTPVEKALLLTTIALVLYEWIFVLPVMAFDARFFQPFVAAVIFLSARASVRLWRAFAAPDAAPAAEASPDSASEGKATRRWALSVAAFAGLLGFWLVPSCTGQAQEAATALFQKKNLHFDTFAFSRLPGPQKNWFRPDAFSELPDGAVIATTEVGLISALSPKRTVIDLAGLNDAEFALHRFSASRLFARGEPDVIYLPHPDYRDMIHEILTAPQIKDYELFAAGSLGSLFGVAIKKRSPYYAQMKAIMGMRAPIPPDQYDR